MLRLEPADEAFAVLEQDCLAGTQHCTGPLPLLLTEQLIFRGRIQKAEQSLKRIPDAYRIGTACFQGWLALLHGNHEQAIAYYSSALSALKKAAKKRNTYFNGIAGLFFILALLRARSPRGLREAEDYAGLMARPSKHWLAPIYSFLHKVLQLQQGNLSNKDELLRDSRALEGSGGLHTLIGSLCLYWVEPERARKRLPSVLRPLCQRATQAGYHWLATETAELLARLGQSRHHGEVAATRCEASRLHSVIDVINPQAALGALPQCPRWPTPGSRRRDAKAC